MSRVPAINTPVPGISTYYPLNEPAIGTAYDADSAPLLFKPLKIRDTVFKNRVFVAPMCQYSSQDGHATDWHLVHIGGFATRGVGAICMEATAVVPEGRISPEDAGLWTDSQIPPLKRIVEFSHAHGTKIGVQLAHAGRKASTHAPWVQPGKDGVHTAVEDENGWPNNVFGPSTLPYHELYPRPKAMTEQDIDALEEAFAASTKRCIEIGYDFIELHGAHGYLIHSFLSPLSNNRTDQYGGSLENRMRLLLRLIKRVRAEMPAGMPLFVRISASDWAAGLDEKGVDGEWAQWGIEQSKILTGEMIKLGVDLIDVSSAGNWADQKITIKPGYQVHFAEAIKKEYDQQIVVSAVGLIKDPKQAEDILQQGQADVVSLARALMRNPHWVMEASVDLHVPIKLAVQYERIGELRKVKL